MTPHDLLANLQVLAEAPKGIKRLRELVLELAVRGKLVEQDLEDSSPLDFLASLELLRNRGTRSKCANPKLPLIPSEDVPFAIPPSWVWTKFEFTHINRDSERIPLSREERSGQKGPYDYYGASGIIDQIDRYIFDGPLLLLGEDGANLVIRSTPIAFLATGKYWVNNHAHVLDSPSEMSLRYLAIFLNQCDLKPYLTGTAQPKLNQARMNGIPCPFPPLSEQRRIVARVDELMALLDRLEAKHHERESARAAARDSALAALREAPTPDDVETAWLRIQERFHELFGTPWDVDPLRQAILQLAIRGRLVAQDSGDEPVHDLIDRLHQKKTRLIKEGSVRAGIPPLPISSEEAPFELPYGWTWLRMEEICVIKGGVTKGRNLQGRDVVDIPYLRVANVQAGRVDLRVMKTINLPVEELEDYRLESGDVLLTEGGDWDKLGRSAVWASEIDPCIYQNHIFRARPLDEGIQSMWISGFTNSPDGRAHFQSCAKRTTNLASINMTQLKNCPIPVPPPQEQARILLRLDELMAKLDQLEDALEIETELSSAFAAAAAHHLDA